MTTWLEELRKQNPALAADYAITGNVTDNTLRQMIAALSTAQHLNSPDQADALEAAKRILAHKARVAERQGKTLALATANQTLFRQSRHA